MGEGGDRVNLPVEDLAEKQHGEDHQEQAVSALRDDADLVPKEAGDSGSEQQSGAGSAEVKDFMPHLLAAEKGEQQWEALAGAEGKINIQDASGQVHEVDAKEYRGQLETFIEQQYEAALEAAKALPEEFVQKMEDRIFSPERNKETLALMEKYGFVEAGGDPADKGKTVSVADVDARQKKTENIDEFMELEKLKDLIVERGLAQKIIHAQGDVSVEYAEFLLKRDQPKKAKDILVEAAAKDPELRYDRGRFKPLKEKTEEMLLQRSKLAVNDLDNPRVYMQAAQEMIAAGNRDDAEAFFKKAVELADEMPVEASLKEADEKIAEANRDLSELRRQYPEAAKQYDEMDTEAKAIFEEQQRLLQIPEAQREKEEVTRLQERARKLEEDSVKFENEVDGADKFTEAGRRLRFFSQQKDNWEVFDRVDSTARWQYAKFLLDESNEGRPNRYKDAQKLLEHVEEDDPELIVMQGAEFLDLKAQAKSEGKLGSSITQKYAKCLEHLQSMQTEAKKGEDGGEPNVGKIKAELWRAYKEVNDPNFRREALDQWRRTNELIKQEKAKPASERDQDNLKLWEAQRSEYDQMYNQGGLILAQMAAIEGSMDNRAAGRQYMEMLDRDYPDLNQYSKWNFLKLDATRDNVRELAWYESAWKWTKDNSAEICATVGSIAAGVGTFAVLTGSTLGFGAPVGVAGGIAAGAATGSAIRAAFGSEVTIGTVVMDGLGGLSGPAAIGARGFTAARLGLTATNLAGRTGLRVAATEFLKRGAVNAATGLGFSAAFRGGKTFNNYYEGRYNSLGDAAKDYAAGVGTDTAASFVGGTYLQYGFKLGAPTSAALHISKEALLGNSKNKYEFGANVLDGMTNDLFAAWSMQFGIAVAGKVPVASSLPLKDIGVGAMPAMRGSMYAPMWKDMYNQLNPVYNYDNKPKGKGEEIE